VRKKAWLASVVFTVYACCLHFDLLPLPIQKYWGSEEPLLDYLLWATIFLYVYISLVRSRVKAVLGWAAAGPFFAYPFIYGNAVAVVSLGLLSFAVLSVLGWREGEWAYPLFAVFYFALVLLLPLDVKMFIFPFAGFYFAGEIMLR